MNGAGNITPRWEEMKLLRIGPRQIVNLDKNERLVAVSFDKEKLKPFVIVEGLGVQFVELTMEELETKLVELNGGEII